MANEGPSASDMALMSQRMNSSGGGGGGGGGSGGEGSRDFIETIFNNSTMMLRRFTGIKIDTLFNTGVFKQFDSKGLFDGPINKGASALSAKGGAVANFISTNLQLETARDFSKIVKPSIEPLPVIDVPIVALGSLRPSEGGGGVGGRYLG